MYGEYYINDYPEVAIDVRSSSSVIKSLRVNLNKENLEYIRKYRAKWGIEYTMSQVPSFRLFTPEFKESQIL